MLPIELIAVLGGVFAFVLFIMVRRAYHVARTQERAEYRTDYQQETSE